jgi:death-on-curing protein
MIEFLSLEEALQIHEQQIELFGGSHGLRDRGLLESALAQPQATFFGQYLHADLFAMAAAYLFHIAMNHPFIDGNKRVAAATAVVFLQLNGWIDTATDEELVDITLGVASGQIGKEQIADFFRQHSQQIG